MGRGEAGENVMNGLVLVSIRTTELRASLEAALANVKTKLEAQRQVTAARISRDRDAHEAYVKAEGEELARYLVALENWRKLPWYQRRKTPHPVKGYVPEPLLTLAINVPELDLAARQDQLHGVLQGLPEAGIVQISAEFLAWLKEWSEKGD